MYQQEDYDCSQDMFGDDVLDEVARQPGTFLDDGDYPPSFSELELSPSYLNPMTFTDSDGSIHNVMNNADLLNATRLGLRSDSNGTETKPGVEGLIGYPVDAVSVGSQIPAGTYFLANPGNDEPISPEDMIPETEDGLFESWSGERINFQITPLVDAKKALYSEERNKVYCNTDTAVTFKVQMNFQLVQNLEDLMIRSFLAFEDNGSRNRAVLRCATHKIEEERITDRINRGRLDHILRPQNPKANMVYFQNEKSQRCYLLIPLKAPEPGMNFVKTTLCFTCRNSCATSGSDGKAKKDIAIMFFLFNKKTGEILGRQHINIRVCSAPTRDYNKEHGISNGAASNNRKRKYADGAEAALLPTPKHVNVGSGEVPLSHFQPSEQGVVVVPIAETQQMRSTVRAAKVDDDGVSSSQETVFSVDEAPERINLKGLLKDVKWALRQKHSLDPALANYATNVYASLKMTQALCNSAKELDAQKRQEKQSETSPDGGFHDVAHD